MPDLVIVGAGGFGREALDVHEAMRGAGRHGGLRLVGVVDDAPTADTLDILAARGVPYLGTITEAIARAGSARLVVAVGNPAIRAGIVADLARAGARWATLVHPASTLGVGSTVGAGSVICAGARIGTHVRLGEHNHLNANAVVGHDAVLADLVSINPAACVSGRVRIGSGTLVGANATILQGLAVGENAVLGAAACLTKDLPAHSTAVGVPARW